MIDKPIQTYTVAVEEEERDSVLACFVWSIHCTECAVAIHILPCCAVYMFNLYTCPCSWLLDFACWRVSLKGCWYGIGGGARGALLTDERCVCACVCACVCVCVCVLCMYVRVCVLCMYVRV